MLHGGGLGLPAGNCLAQDSLFQPLEVNGFYFITTGAVSALAKFGAQNEEMLPSILVLLKR